jgi:Tfp pilus assembly protein PilO
VKKIKLQAREKVLLALAVSAAICYGFYSFWFVKYNQQINLSKAEITIKEAEYDANKKLIAKLPAYTAKKPEMEALAIKLADQLPTIEVLPSVLGDLKGVIESNGVTAKSISLDKNATKKSSPNQFDSKTVQLSVLGSYSQIINAINSLENNGKRTYTVGNISLDKSEDGTIKGNIMVDVYLAKSPVPGFEYKPLIETEGKTDIFN